MPRHPPTALNNLNHNKPTHTTKPKRCSHPLYNSQTPHHTTNNTPHTLDHSREQFDAQEAGQPKTTQHACCLRTQQRTDTPHPPARTHPLHTPEEAVLGRIPTDTMKL